MLFQLTLGRRFARESWSGLLPLHCAKTILALSFLKAWRLTPVLISAQREIQYEKKRLGRVCERLKSGRYI